MITVFAGIACFILACLAIFQFALILGAPIGKYAWGGSHSVLPANLRIGSAVSIILYVIFALIILDNSGVIAVIDDNISNFSIWFVTVYFFIGVIMNSISRSKQERNVMTPTALMLAVLFLLVALS